MTDKKTIGEKNYEQFADAYAEKAADKPHNAHYDRPAILSLLPDLAGKKLLDAGCGPGIYAEIFLDRGAEVVAFDVTPDFVRITQDRVGDKATVLQGDLTQPLTFAADSDFDIIVSSLVLDYIEDWHAVFREFHRVLKPGGIVVFSCGHPMGDYLWFEKKQMPVKYFETELFEMEWGGFGEIRPRIMSYRRSLQSIINPVLESGLLLDKILEPLPTERFKDLDPEGYAELIETPAFIHLRARKPVTENTMMIN